MAVRAGAKGGGHGIVVRGLPGRRAVVRVRLEGEVCVEVQRPGRRRSSREGRRVQNVVEDLRHAAVDVAVAVGVKVAV